MGICFSKKSVITKENDFSSITNQTNASQQPNEIAHNPSRFEKARIHAK